MVKIADVVRVKEFAPVIELDMASQPQLYRQLVDQYIVTEDLADLFARILNSPLPAGGAAMSQVLNWRAHLITAQYGSGKSYFLLMLASVLESLGDPERVASVQAKFSGFPGVLKALNELKGKRFLAVRLNAKGQGDVPLRELLVRSLREAALQVKPDLVLDSEYSAASDNLRRLKGTEAGQLFERQLQQEEGISCDSLRDGLLDLQHASLLTYRAVYSQVFQASAPHTGLDLAKSFSSTLDQLKGKDYTHIVILADEMTQYLQSSAHHYSLKDTLGVLEDFAEFCNDGKNRCLLVAAMHRSLRRILQEQGIDPDQEEDWHKFVGRFADHDIQFSNYERMLEQVFEISPKLKEHADNPVVRMQVADLQVSARQYLNLKQGTPVPQGAYFPLHPATLRYLTGVSGRLGQEKRTAFSFLKDEVRAALAEEELLVDQRLNILGPDRLFDYFLPDLEHEDELGILYAYNVAQSRLAADGLALQIFKALAMQYCAQTTLASQGAGVIGQGMTLAGLVDVLNIADEAKLKPSLDLLLGIKPSTVYFDHATGQYWFVPGGQDDIDSEIANIIDGFDPHEELRKWLKSLGDSVELNQPDTVDVIVPRTIKCEWHGVGWLKKQPKIPREKEARFVFVIPEFVESYDGIPTELEQRAKQLARDGVCLILPRTSNMLLPHDLREVAALRSPGIQEKAKSSLQYARVLNTRLTNAEERVKQSLLKFGDAKNLVFYIECAEFPANSFEEAARRVLMGLYPKFPRVAMERISGRKVTNAVINTLVASKQRTIADTEQSEEARFIRDAMPAMGLVRLTPIAGGKAASLTIPEVDGDGYDIWVTMDRALREKKSFDQFNSALQGTPFGLPDFIREVYLAAYLAFRKVAIRDIHQNHFETTVSADLIKDMVSKGKRGFDIFLTEGSTDALRPFVLSVWALVEEAQGQYSYKHIKVDTVGDLPVWNDSIRPALRNYANGRLGLTIETLSDINKPLGIISGGQGQIADDYLGAFQKGLLELATDVDYVLPTKGYPRLLELCQLLPGDTPASAGMVTTDQAYYRLKGLDVKCENLVEDSHAGGSAVAVCISTILDIRKLTENKVGEEHMVAAQAAGKALQQCCANLFDKGCRQRFVDSVKAFWTGYVTEHVAEHDIIHDLRMHFGQTLLGCPQYALLDKLSCLEFGLMKAPSILAATSSVRAKSCITLNAVPPFPQTLCSKCRQFYMSGSSQQISNELALKETQLREGLLSALAAYLIGIRAFEQKPRFSEYLGQQGKKEQQAWQQFRTLDISATVQDPKPILPITSALVSIILGFDKYERIPPVARVPVETLLEKLGEYFTSHGVTEPSYSELDEQMRRWLAQIKNSYYK